MYMYVLLYILLKCRFYIKTVCVPAQSSGSRGCLYVLLNMYNITWRDQLNYTCVSPHTVGDWACKKLWDRKIKAVSTWKMACCVDTYTFVVNIHNLLFLLEDAHE